MTTGDLGSKLLHSPVANSLAILVLLSLRAVLTLVVTRIVRVWPDGLAVLAQEPLDGWRRWAVAGLCLIGLGVSCYTAFVESTHTEALCGPVGDCNTV